MVAKLSKPLKVALIALFWFLVWEIASLLIGKRLLFPSPIDVTVRLAQLIITKDFLISCLYSLGRISFGIIIAIILGFITALLCHFSSTLYEILYPLVTVIKSTPVASFIILIWIFVGNSITPVFISALMVFPIVFANIYQGIKNVDKDLLEVCKVYNIPHKKMMKSLYVPSVVPYFLSALLSSIGLGWKAGIAAEVLCTPLNSIGKGIFEAKTYIEYVDLFAWTVTVIILSLVFELLLTKLIRRLFSKITKKQVKPNGN